MKKLDMIALALLILAGITWGLWSVFDFNLIDYVFGKVWIDRVLYFVMGVAAIYVAIVWKNVISALRKKH